MTEQQDASEGAVTAQDNGTEQPTGIPAGEPEAPVAPPAEPVAQEPQEPASEPAAQEPQPPAEPVAQEPQEPASEPAAQEPAGEPGDPAEQPAPAAEQPAAEQPAAEQPAAAAEEPAVGPKIIGVAKDKPPVPVVKRRLQEKPKRDPLPWPELRAAVAATKDDLDVAELKELFRLFPAKVRDEVTENVRGFRKGARRPISQHAAKQLARAVHTARRMKRNSSPSDEVSEALGQAMAAELLASLEPERAAEVILPKRDLLEREARTARRRARDEEDKRRDEQRRRRREDAKQSRSQTSFGSFSGAKIKGLDELAAMFQDEAPEAPAAEAPTPAAEPEAPAAEAPTPAAEPEAPVAPADAPADEDPAAQAPGEVPDVPVTEDEPAPGDEPQQHSGS